MLRRLRQAVEALLHLDDTPHRIALAFSLGIWIAFSPLLGLHTLMALGIAFAFRLSRAAILVGAYINNPWTIAPMYIAGTTLGCAMLGVAPDGLGAIDWSLDGRAFYTALRDQMRPFLWPYVLGNTVLGVAGGVIGYLVLRKVLERRLAQPRATSGGRAS